MFSPLFLFAWPVALVRSMLRTLSSIHMTVRATGQEYVAQLTALVEERMCRWQEPQLLATYQIRSLAKRRTTDDNEYAAVYTSVPVSWESSFKDELPDRICGIIISLNNHRRSRHDEEI